MEIGPRSYRMAQWTGCLLALSALTGIALALLASYWPVQVYLLLFASASAMSLFWTLARSGSKKLAQSLTASGSASVEEITRQGKLFRLRFREYNLLWAMIGCASGFLMLHAIGPYASYALIVMAACLTCAAWALIGAILGGRDQTLGVCWRAAFPTTPGRLGEYVPYAGAVMVLRHRREHARDFDRRSGGVCQLWMTAAYELAQAGRQVPVLRFWDRKWENPRRESAARAAVMGGIFLACLLLAALIVPLLQGQAALPPLRNLVSHLLRVPASLLGQTGSGNQSSKGKSGNQGNSGLNGNGQAGDNGKQNGGESKAGQSGNSGQQGASNSGNSGQNANNAGSPGGNQSGNQGANSNGNPQAGANGSSAAGAKSNDGANSSNGASGNSGSNAAQGGGVGGGAQGGKQGNGQQGANGANAGGTNPGQGAGSGAGAKGANAGANGQQSAANGGNPGANPAQGAGAGNSAKGGNQSGTPQGAGSGNGGGPSPKGSQNGANSGQANSSGNGATSEGSTAKGDAKGSSGGATNSQESKESSHGIGHGGPAPTIKSTPVVLEPVPRNPGAVVNVELPSTGPPSPNDKQDDSNQPQDSARKDKPAAPKYQPRPPSKPRNGEAAPNEPQQHWPNWMYWLLRK